MTDNAMLFTLLMFAGCTITGVVLGVRHAYREGMRAGLRYFRVDKHDGTSPVVIVLKG